MAAKTARAYQDKMTLMRKVDAKYTWVKAYRRRRPGKAKPHWIAVKIDGLGHVEAVLTAEGIWSAALGAGELLLRNAAKKLPEIKDRLDTGEVVLVRMD